VTDDGARAAVLAPPSNTCSRTLTIWRRCGLFAILFKPQYRTNLGQMFPLPAVLQTPSAVIGAVVIALAAFKFLAFIWRHFLRPSNSLKRYGADKSKDGSSWAVVTGGSKGIGKQFAKELLKRGMNVIVVARTADSSLEAEVKSASKTRQVVCAKADLFDVQSIEASLRPVLAGKRVTMLINNAGISLDHPDYFLEQTSTSRIGGIIDLNIRAVNEMTRVVLPGMVENKCGGIINVGSISCYVPSMLAVYGASKSYVAAFSQGLASEYKNKGIDVVCITPGLVVSEMSKVRKPRLDCPLPAAVVSKALDSLGGSDVVVSPYWFHDMQEFILGLLPNNFAQNYILKLHQKIKKRAMEKKA
jgi:17beta-estradiol 17-dehydrogenase / very-long-chain 3-oxoacyl-CoA reductase